MPVNYGRPAKFVPRWYVPQLVFQDGVPKTPTGDIAGGGQVPRKFPRGTFTPLVMGYSPPTQSVTGPGDVPSQTPFLQQLFAWLSGSSTSSSTSNVSNVQNAGSNATGS